MLNENEISKLAVSICFKTHYKYGPGLFESVYEEYSAMNGLKQGYRLADSRLSRLFMKTLEWRLDLEQM